jgi:hypothetical protein
MPTTLFSLSHHLSQPGVLRSSDYFSDYDALSVALRAGPSRDTAGVAIWFYNCGSSAERYFWHNSDVPKEPDTSELRRVQGRDKWDECGAQQTMLMSISKPSNPAVVE